MGIQAKLFARDEGKTMRIGRMTFHFKMMAEDTQGAYTVAEAHVPPDSGSGLHRGLQFPGRDRQRQLRCCRAFPSHSVETRH